MHFVSDDLIAHYQGLHYKNQQNNNNMLILVLYNYTLFLTWYLYYIGSYFNVKLSPLFQNYMPIII